MADKTTHDRQAGPSRIKVHFGAPHTLEGTCAGSATTDNHEAWLIEHPHGQAAPLCAPPPATAADETRAYGTRAVAFFTPAPVFAAACPCCVARTPVAQILGRLFMGQMRGEVHAFMHLRVVASAQGEADVRHALRTDPLVAARFTAEPAETHPPSNYP